MNDYGLAAFFMALAAFGLRALATHRLRTRHPTQWAELGHPAPIDQGPGDPGSLSVVRFFFLGEFFQIRDRVLHVESILFDLSVIAGVILMLKAAAG